MASADEVQKLAALSRLSVNEEELARFAKEFDGILAYVGTLEELTVAAHMPRPILRNVFRPDGTPHESGAHTATLVEAFPEREGEYLKVKRIINND